MARPRLSRVHLFLIVVVAIAATTIAGIGFLGSYTAVRELAVEQGFGRFSALFPIGVDVGIIALLALDLLLSWLRIPFFLLRQTAWLLTVATIAMNAASAWPRPLGVGMHAVIPLLFVVIAEAGRHAISRLAKLSDSRRMESVRFMRWVLSPVRTFAMWRRMMLWELRSVDEAVRLEQMRLAYAMLLEDAYGKNWAKAAPRSAYLPLRLAKLGVPIHRTAPQGLAAAGLSDTAFGGLFTAPAPVVDVDAAALPAVAPERTAETVLAPVDLAPALEVEAGELVRQIVTPRGADTLQQEPGEVEEGTAAAAADVLEIVKPEGRPSTDLSEEETVLVMDEPSPGVEPDAASSGQPSALAAGADEGQSREDQLYSYYCHYVERHGQCPEKHLFADFIYREFGQTGQSGTGPVSVQSLRRYWGNLEARYREEADNTQLISGAMK